jgi:peptidoglycan/LPS O-acetylase OafA/YrhL
MYFTTHVWWLDQTAGDDLKQAVTATYLGAYAVFMAAVLMRGKRFPRPLIYLGTVSYSLYLVHSIVIYGVGRVGDHRYVSAAAWVALTVAVSAITYRFIEQPAIEYGRKLGASRTATAPAAW